MDTGIRRGLCTSLAGSLLLGVIVVASCSLPAAASPTPTYSVAQTIDVGTSPRVVAVDPNTGTVYVANSSSPGTVSVISEATDTVTDTITVGNYPDAVAVDPNTAPST